MRPDWDFDKPSCRESFAADALVMHADRGLTAAQRDDLGDARLVLDSATHNTRVALAPHSDRDDARQALANAIEQAEQGLATLRRVAAALDGSADAN